MTKNHALYYMYRTALQTLALAAPTATFATHRVGHVEFWPADRPPAGWIPTTTITRISDFYSAVCAATQWIVVFGILIGAAFVVWGGVRYITSGGDDTKAGDAKSTIRTAVIGIVFLLLAVAVVRIVAGFLGGDLSGFSLEGLTCQTPIF